MGARIPSRLGYWIATVLLYGVDVVCFWVGIWLAFNVHWAGWALAAVALYVICRTVGRDLAGRERRRYIDDL